jgi:hypothetical protein
VGAAARPLQAAKKKSVSTPQEKKVSFIGKESEEFLHKLLYNHY